MAHNWHRIEKTHHEWRIVDRKDRWGKQLISRTGMQIRYRHKYDWFGFFDRKLAVVWSDWKVELEIN